MAVILRETAGGSSPYVSKYEGALYLLRQPSEVRVVPCGRNGREYTWLAAEFWIIRDGIIPA